MVFNCNDVHFDSSVYFVDEHHLVEMEKLIDALDVAGFEKTAEQFSKVAKELRSNKISTSLICGCQDED